MGQVATRKARTDSFLHLNRATALAGALAFGGTALTNPIAADARHALRHTELRTPPVAAYDKYSAAMPIGRTVRVNEGEMIQLGLYAPVNLAPGRSSEPLITAVSDKGYSYTLSIGRKKDGELYGIFEVRDHKNRAKAVKVMGFDSAVPSGDLLLLRIGFSGKEVYARINGWGSGDAVNAQCVVPAFGGRYFAGARLTTYGEGDPDYTVFSNAPR